MNRPKTQERFRGGSNFSSQIKITVGIPKLMLRKSQQTLKAQDELTLMSSNNGVEISASKGDIEEVADVPTAVLNEV